MKFGQFISFYNIAVLSMSLRNDPSPGHIYNHMSIPTAFHFIKKRTFIPSPIFLESKKPWPKISKLLDALLAFD